MERAFRLRKGSEFDSVYREGTVVGGPLLVVRYLANEEGHPRWGFAVGKRLAKRAVVRNAVRRRLREAARQIEGVAPADIVVTARAGALTASYRELARALERALRKAGLILHT